MSIERVSVKNNLPCVMSVRCDCMLKIRAMSAWYAQCDQKVLALQVTLALLTPSQSSTREVTLTREKIANAPVSHQLCSSVSNSVGPASTSGKLGFVRIATFNKQTTESAKAAFRQLKADGASRSSL